MTFAVRFRHILLSLILLICASDLFAQKEVLYSQYLINPLAINPAYAGSRQTMHLTAMFRRKWFGLRNVPITQTLAIDGAVGNGRLGLGLQALNDRMSILSTTGVYASIAYRFPLSETSDIAIGGQGGVNVMPVFDPTTRIGLNKAIASVGVGIYYNSESFFGGISLPELVNRGYELSGQFLFQNTRPLFIQLGTRLDIAENAVLVPSLLVTQVTGKPIGTDLNAKLWLNERLGLGLSLRRNSLGLGSINYIQGIGEYQLSQFIRVGYIYNSRTPEAPNSFGNSVHEFIFRWAPNAEGFTF
ncbi:type IX secretion system membrane protein PorP/SprF [Nibrella saemangeumensis]